MIPLSLRIKLVKAVTFLALLAGFLLSPSLWRNEGRFFPLIKALEGIPTLGAPFDRVLPWLFTGLGLLWVFYKKKSIGIIVLIILLLMLVQDQMRWQPWVYIYLLLLLPYLSSSDNNGKEVFNTLQWIIAGVYVWSGFHKLNVNFIEGPFAQMVTDSGMDTDFSQIKKLGYFIPLIEMLTGVALLVPRFRKAGVCAAVMMHLFILFYLSQWSAIKNTVVYPWNTAMILFDLLLFLGVREASVFPVRHIRARPFMAIPVLLAWIFPLFNLWGYWDHYLSFSFYSNKPCQYYIAVKESQIEEMDKRLQPYFVTMEGLKGSKVIDLNNWSLSELNVPFYPEKRLFRKLGSSFCHLNTVEDNLFFIVLSFTDGQPHFVPYSCTELAGPMNK